MITVTSYKETHLYGMVVLTVIVMLHPPIYRLPTDDGQATVWGMEGVFIPFEESTVGERHYANVRG